MMLYKMMSSYVTPNTATTISMVSWRMVASILPSKKEFIRVLLSGKRLRFYWGIDPTSPDVHLGHVTNLLFLRDMQKLGHEIILLIGDFTARIGDPSGRDSVRVPLSAKQVRANASTYVAQASKILRFSGGRNPVRVVWNSRWLDRLTLKDFIGVTSHLTVQQLAEREMFQRRTAKGNPIWLHEFLYPVLQGYDSVALEVDAEVGGEDQLYNMLIGRKLLEAFCRKSKFVITTRLLVNPKTGGKLMSKSVGNYVSLRDTPEDMYAKTMALPDEAVWQCFELSTDLPDETITRLKNEVERGIRKMRDAKAMLARTVVERFHSARSAERAQAAFERIFVKKLPPEVVHTVKCARGNVINVPEFLVSNGLASSKSEAIRLITSGAVKFGDSIIGDWRAPIICDHDVIVRVGKRKFLRIRVQT